MGKPKETTTVQDSQESRQWLELVRDQVGSLAFGVVQITVHNSRVTQIDRTVRTRLDSHTSSLVSPASVSWR